MEKQLNQKIEKYCELIVKSGLNVQKGQKVVITSPVDCAEFARIMAEKAYNAGAKQVIMRWGDEPIMRLTYLHADPAIFDVCDPWITMMMDQLSEEGSAFLSIAARDPEAYRGVNPDYMQRYNRATSLGLEAFYNRTMANEVPWCVVSVPTEAWATKVFPDAKDADEAIGLLWDAILKSSRVDDGDASENWSKHDATLKARSSKLNAYDFEYITAKASNGTDLKIELPKGHIWAGGAEYCPVNEKFSPNIPTEEIFSAPHKLGVNGVVKSSKPLLHNGNLIDKFTVWFENGKAVKVHAEQNQKLLEDLITEDENSAYLGEIALVPYHSPISESGILFYNTLYDENASCHLAFGRGYPMCIKDSAGKTNDELVERGLNYSITHVDFMFGTEDMNIQGVTRSGEVVDVFVNGDFTF